MVDVINFLRLSRLLGCRQISLVIQRVSRSVVAKFFFRFNSMRILDVAFDPTTFTSILLRNTSQAYGSCQAEKMHVALESSSWLSLFPPTSDFP